MASYKYGRSARSNSVSEKSIETGIFLTSKKQFKFFVFITTTTFRIAPKGSWKTSTNPHWIMAGGSCSRSYTGRRFPRSELTPEAY